MLNCSLTKHFEHLLFGSISQSNLEESLINDSFYFQKISFKCFSYRNGSFILSYGLKFFLFLTYLILLEMLHQNYFTKFKANILLSIFS